MNMNSLNSTAKVQYNSENQQRISKNKVIYSKLLQEW